MAKLGKEKKVRKGKVKEEGSRGRARNIFFSKTTKPALGASQPPIQWVPELRLGMTGATPLYSFKAWTAKNLRFTSLSNKR
jgi:hypothetical protein